MGDTSSDEAPFLGGIGSGSVSPTESVPAMGELLGGLQLLKDWEEMACRSTALISIWVTSS